jgi:uncharacterized protein
MHVRRFDDAASFSEHVTPFLVRHEAANNLLLGITATLIKRPDRYGDDPPYLAVVERDEEIIAVSMCTPPFNLLISRMDDQAALPCILDDVRARIPLLAGVVGPVETSRAFAEQWSVSTGSDFYLGHAMRIFQIERVNPVKSVPGEMRRATGSDRPLLVDWLTAFGEETNTETDDVARAVEAYLSGDETGLFIWEHGAPVSIAGLSGPTPNGIRINAVYTPPELRRRGYASALVARLSQAMLDSGRRYCFLFADLANPTSNRIYQAIGYEPVCDVSEFRFRA